MAAAVPASVDRDSAAAVTSSQEHAAKLFGAMLDCKVSGAGLRAGARHWLDGRAMPCGGQELGSSQHVPAFQRTSHRLSCQR
jgi:hypothetical protein